MSCNESDLKMQSLSYEQKLLKLFESAKKTEEYWKSETADLFREAMKTIELEYYDGKKNESI